MFFTQIILLNIATQYNQLFKKYTFCSMSRLQQPVDQRRKALERKKAAYQFLRDVEDEKMWINERLPLARSRHLGDSLFDCNRLQKKHQVSALSFHCQHICALTFVKIYDCTHFVNTFAVTSMTVV
jgi:hypothetical protein